MNTDNISIYILGGEIDHHSSQLIRTEMDKIILEERPDVFEIDFTNVKFMDSSGIGLILGRYRTVSTFGGRIRIKGVSQNLLRLLKMSGVDKFAEITEH